MIAIKERPILLSGPMIRAVLEGRKTVTRRAVKGAGLKWLEDFTPEYVADPANSLCPYGKPGDRLWVRETFAYADKSGAHDAAPDDHWRPSRPGMEPEIYRCWYRASDGHTADGFWKPSIHMPRWASRILLEITDIRVERLQDISEAQCIAEGIQPVPKTNEHSHQFWRDYHLSGDGTFCVRTPKESFESLWCHVAGGSFPKGAAAYEASPHSWNANPWVWCVEFRRVTP